MKLSWFQIYNDFDQINETRVMWIVLKKKESFQSCDYYVKNAIYSVKCHTKVKWN